MRRGLGSRRGSERDGAWERGRTRRFLARLTLVLAGVALLIAAAPPGPASLFGQEPGGAMAADRSVTVILPRGGDYYVVPAGAAPTTAAGLFSGVDVTSLWKYTADGDWIAYDPGSGSGDFAIAGGDLLWIAVPRIQAITVPVTDSAPPPPRPIALTLREGGGFYVVPAGAPTTAGHLFGGTDVAIVWQYDRATRAWDRAYEPAQDRDDFIITAGDILWVVAPRALVVSG